MQDYVYIDTGEGQFAISPSLVSRVAFQSAYFKAKRESATKIPNKEGVGLPTTYHYKFDYKKAKSAGLLAAGAAVQRVFDLVTKSELNLQCGSPIGLGLEVKHLRDHLFQMERAAEKAKQEIITLNKAASKESMANIASTVTAWKGAKWGAELIRDGSTEFILLAAATLTGGTSYAVMGAASFAKGLFKYQDTENAGAALLTASTSFLTSIIPVPTKGTVPNSQYYAMLFAKTQVEVTGNFAVSLVEGKSIPHALIETGVNLGVSQFANWAFSGPEVKKLIEKIDDVAIPVKVTLKDTVNKAIAKEHATQLVAREFVKKVYSTGTAAALDAVKNSKQGSASELPVKIPASLAMVQAAIVGPNVSCPYAY